MKKSNYSDVKNITIKGGTWSFKNKTGFKGSSIRFAHASKMKFYNMTLKHTNYDGHCFEFIACKDVTMSNDMTRWTLAVFAVGLLAAASPAAASSRLSATGWG